MRSEGTYVFPSGLVVVGVCQTQNSALERCVRSLSTSARFDESLDEHHWLGHRLVGETMRYVAVGGDGQWLAVLGFGAAALACKPRDTFIG